MAQRYTNMREVLAQIREGYSPKEIKMAIGIANDPRYKGGNYSGAVKQIEKIKKGLSNHKQVAAVLKRLNTDFDPELKEEPASPDEGGMAVQQLEFMMHAITRMKQHISQGGEFPEWMQNKLSGAHEKVKGLYANIEHDDMNEEFEIDEMKMDDPKLIKIFDKLKRGSKVKLKTSSTISKGKDFVDYIVKSKNMVNKGRVEKITLATKDNPTSVKKFLYKRDGKVTFAIGDMGASIDDIKEGTVHIHREYEPSQGYEAEQDLKKLLMDIKKAGGKVKDIQKPSRREPNLSIEVDGDLRKIKKQIEKDDDGMTNVEEETKQPVQWPSQPLEEKLKVSDGLGAWIDDFKKSDAPQFQGKSDEEKKNMAIAAFTDAGGKLDEEKVTCPECKGKGCEHCDGKGYHMKEEEEPKKSDGAKSVDQARDDKKKTRIAQLQLQIAKAQETINKLNSQEK